MRAVLSAALSAALAACGGDERDPPFGSGTQGPAGTGIGDESGGDGDGGDGDGDGTGDGAGDGDGDGEDGPTFDVGGDGDGDGGTCGQGDGECGCSAVDLLFVIDDSGSMQDYQIGLAAVFPEFVDAIVASLPAGTDLHVGITSTSFGDPSAGGKGGSGCSNAQYNDEAEAQHYPPPSEDNGQNGGQGRLFEHAGKRFFAGNTADDPTALTDWFTGAAVAVGDQGSNWEMVSAGGAWVAHPENAAFNAGFLRDKGAVLVVFVLTDEYDNSPEEVAAYHDMLAGAKAGCGGDTCIVSGGLVPPCIPDTPGNILGEFLGSFGEPPILGGIGSPGETDHYPDVLGEALAQVIGETCESIPPEG